MNKGAFFLFLCMACSPMVSAEDLVIGSFNGPGRLEFTAPSDGTDYVYRVEWAPAPGGPWTDFPSAAFRMDSIQAEQGSTTTCSVPMCYRVVASRGEYLEIDLSEGSGAESYPVTYYRTYSDIPEEPGADTYKTTKLLMRLIPKGTFAMGSPTNELGRSYLDDETQHEVTLTKDYYIGVFEVTQEQWYRVMGNWPSWFKNPSERHRRPVEQVSYNDIREGPTNSAINPNWPQSSQVYADSFMGRLRAKTGLTTLDLPTEAQWERACRAGTATALNSGKNLTDAVSCTNAAEVGRYWYNGGNGYGESCGPTSGTAVVGSYLPNHWGLCDMHGNVREWCLDWYDVYPASATDPLGAASGACRVLRGGGWNYPPAEGCRSAYRGATVPEFRSASGDGIARNGFRLAMTLP